MSQSNNSEETKDVCQNHKPGLIVILDESASMHTMGNEPKDAVNNFIREQQSSKDDNDTTFSLWKFNNNVTKMIDDENLKETKEFTCYTPMGMTALNDAIGQAIVTKKSKDQNKNVICVIISDGYENSSKNYDSLQIKNMIQEMENEYKWKFIYLGANQDVYMAGNNMGVNHKRCANFDQVPGGLLEITRFASQTISSYRSIISQDDTTDVDLDISNALPHVTNMRAQSCPVYVPEPKRHRTVHQIPPSVPSPLPLVRQSALLGSIALP